MSDGISDSAVRNPADLHTARSEWAWNQFRSIKDTTTLKKVMVKLMENQHPPLMEIGSSDVNCECVNKIMCGDVIVKDGKVYFNDDVLEQMLILLW